MASYEELSHDHSGAKFAPSSQPVYHFAHIAKYKDQERVKARAKLAEGSRR